MRSIMADTEEKADNIVTAILDGKRPEVPEDLYTDDLVLHADEFRLDSDIVSNLGGGFPCVRRSDDLLVPIAIASSSGRGPSLLPWPLFRQHYLRRDADDIEVQFVEPKEAMGLLRTGMVRFLSSRIRSLSEDLGDRIERVKLQLPRASLFGFGCVKISTSGFRVDVSASPNLRVHVSPTFRRRWRFFASPTSPAIGTLPGGIYEFGVDGGPYAAITPDSGTFDIPYATVTPALAL
jgi:hypothetical protein